MFYLYQILEENFIAEFTKNSISLTISKIIEGKHSKLSSTQALALVRHMHSSLLKNLRKHQTRTQSLRVFWWGEKIGYESGWCHGKVPNPGGIGLMFGYRDAAEGLKS